MDSQYIFTEADCIECLKAFQFRPSHYEDDESRRVKLQLEIYIQYSETCRMEEERIKNGGEPFTFL